MQGVGQVVNNVTHSNVVREDNIIRTGIHEVGRTIGGDSGAKIAYGAYDAAVIAANLCAGKVGLQQAGKLQVKVNINNVFNNPLDEFVTIGPSDGVIQQYCRTIPRSGYGKIYATQLGNGIYQIAKGHHRVAALRALSYATIKIFITLNERGKFDMNNIICNKVIDVTKEGITLESDKKKIYISFDDCVKNFFLEKNKEFCKCVATRDITKLSFTFYTHPKINVVFKRSFFKDLITGKSAVSRFLDMQKAIVEVGYTSFDLS